MLGLPTGPLAVPRVALVDFDVHHGDGSEEIVRKLSEALPANALFFCSIHLYDPGDASFGAKPHCRIFLTAASCHAPLPYLDAAACHAPSARCRERASP